MSQTQPTLPTNPFTQVNLTKEANSSSYDNAEMLEMAQNVYHFAQQRASKTASTSSGCRINDWSIY